MNSATFLLVQPLSPPVVPRTASAVEAELFTAIMRGAPGWQKLAYDEYQSLVRGLVVKSLGPSGDIEDVVSDIFIRFFENGRRIRTPEGSIMGVNYATNDSNVVEDHTGADVPLFAYGAGASSVPAAVRQTDIFHIMLRHLGLTAPTSP